MHNSGRICLLSHLMFYLCIPTNLTSVPIMTTSTNKTSAPLMRQSCDRCHKQKLRCTRAGNNGNTGACDRCFRKHSHCVFSSSLPKGRPSMYADDCTGPKNTDLTNRPPSVLVDDPPPVSKSIEGMSLDLSTDLWPWKEPWNWEDASMDWVDQDMGQSILNQHAMIDAAQIDITMVAMPDLLGCTAAPIDVNSDDYAQRQPAPMIATQSLPQSLGHGHGQGSGHVGESSSTCFRGGNGDNDDPDVVIAELAHLSVHLSPLRRSIYGLVGCVESSYHKNQARQKSCIDDATFEAVAGWLSHGHGPANDTINIFSSPPQNPPFFPLPAPEGGTASAMLYNTFAASRHLLEILTYMQDNVGVSGTSTLSKPTPSTTPSLISASSRNGLYFGLPMLSSSSLSSSHPHTPGGSPSKYCNNIIRHLVIACHTMLLDIYVAVLAILECDTDPNAYRDNTAALGDIR